MSQLAMELSHINRERKGLESAFRGGKLTYKEYLDYDIKYLSQSSGRIGHMVSIIVSAAKHGRKVGNLAEKQNLIDRTEAINTGSPENEMTKCPDQEKLITRAECLEFSGDAKNTEQCKSCDNFTITRNLLLPKQ